MASHPLVLVKSPLDPRDTTECWICNGREDGRRDVNVGRTMASFTAVHDLHNDRFAVAGVCDCRSERDVTLSISLRIAVGQTVTTNQDRACIGLDNRLKGTSHVKDLSTWCIRSANGIAYFNKVFLVVVMEENNGKTYGWSLALPQAKHRT